MTPADRYLELVIEAVNGSLYAPGAHQIPFEPPTRLWRAISRLARSRGLAIGRPTAVKPEAYETGVGWPLGFGWPGYSMVGRQRLRNVRDAVETVIREGVPGDLVEAGVWRGGSSIVMKATLEAHGDGRRVVLADSFEGLPAVDASDDAAYLHDDKSLAVSEDQVRAALAAFGLLDERVELVRGWFSDTLPGLAGRSWAVVRLDGDQYGSTMDGLTNLYPGLSPGGFLIVDDYGAFESCRRAVTEYREAQGITAPIVDVDGTGAYWRKG